MGYLTEALATYYLEAYEHSKHCVDEVWKLNPKLEEYLNQINTSEHIRTLYSRTDAATGSLDKNSYVAFCYSESVEEYLETVFIPKLEVEFGDDVILKFRKTPPVVTQKVMNTNPDLKYVVSSTYRNVWLQHILIRGNYTEKHFWEFITKELTNIKVNEQI